MIAGVRRAVFVAIRATSGMPIERPFRILLDMRDVRNAGCYVRAGALVCALALLAPTVALAEGEHSPMFGAAAVGTGGASEQSELAGFELEAGWWYWRFGLSAEGSMMWGLEDVEKRANVLGLSARLLVFDALVESLIEPRDVELGVELHGVVERAWWSGESPAHDPTRYGVGVALRLRGGSEYDMSRLLAESRFFVRVMSARWETEDTIARSTTAPERSETSGMMIVIGLGAAFGTGEPAYLERFRVRPFSPNTRQLASSWFY